MKLKALNLLFILFISFNSFSQFNNEYFAVTSASSQGWSGGAAGSGGGTNYTFILSFLKDVEITFDSVWLGGGDALYLYGDNSLNALSFKKGNTCTLYSSIYYQGERELYTLKSEIETSSHPPVFYKGKALIRFKINNEVYYYAVEEMKILTPIPYP
jgi:hypothetical protein